jgi:DNA helicase-2/ATP-dependent DNA helicase PcrA
MQFLGAIVVNMSNATGAPQLRGDALGAVDHRGTHLQIIAAAGSGKTEVVSQRIVSLIADGVASREIVGFTFTEKAAEELKQRVSLRLAERLGIDALDRLSGLYIGTIHGYCYQFLQANVAKYETYDVLDSNQHIALLSREAQFLKLKELDKDGKLFTAIKAFAKAVDVIDNELLDATTMPEPLRSKLAEYYETLDRYRMMSFGMQIARTVKELERKVVREKLHASLKHLIVDEYQDINPAQQRLIQLMTGPTTELCVVGDDDQAIYQWRGSTVASIVNFTTQYQDAKTFRLETNRRSLPVIVDAASRFAESIPNRLPKKMNADRTPPSDFNQPQIVAWDALMEVNEATILAGMVTDLVKKGVPYSGIAVLVRGKTSYKAILDAFAEVDIPVQPGGRTGLFASPEARVLGRMMSWLIDEEWRDQYTEPSVLSEPVLVQEFTTVFSLEATQQKNLKKALVDWKKRVPSDKESANLLADVYDILEILDLKSWNFDDPMVLNRLGSIARFSVLLTDYETVQRRSRPDPKKPGEMIGGQDRGEWYYRGFARFVNNYANGTFDGFEGEDDYSINAVDLTTVHSAKGLEWPAVFVPSLTSKRFPSSKNGSQQDWLVPREMFDASRYEGSDEDERRLFYVAITRARDWLSLSRHKHVKSTKSTAGPSPYFSELSEHCFEVDEITVPKLTAKTDSDSELIISYSDLASFMECGHAFRLRQRLGFRPRIAEAIGYGRAIHHILRTVAEITKESGNVPDQKTIDKLLDSNFFLPNASKFMHQKLKQGAKRLIDNYVTEHSADLRRVFETERPFELHLDGVTIVGRADVILDYEDGVPSALALVDYKSATVSDNSFDLQLQIYTDAGRREGLDVQASYVHDLDSGVRVSIDVSPTALKDAEARAVTAANQLKQRVFLANPEKNRCKNCEVRTICSSRSL